ncbi:MAG: hypothetical protein JWP35_2147 [Caulobacter sp.]|nr:hypothetical protein [Caulobacter sp.]
MAHTFSKICLALAISVTCAACNNPARDGLARAGHVQDVGDISGDTIRDADLTDAAALLAKLQAIAKAAPPVDLSSNVSMAARRAFFVAQRSKALGTRTTFLLPITCKTGQPGTRSTLTFDPATKNVWVRIYGGSAHDDATVTVIRSLIASQVEDYEAAESALAVSGGLAAQPHRQPVDLPPSVRSLAETSSAIHLGAGPILALTNSDLGGVDYQLDLSFARARVEHEEFRSKLLAGRHGDRTATLQLLRNEDRLWMDWPDSHLPEPFWRRSLPYGGDPKQLCLVGRFKELDLNSGGELSTPLVSPEADLTGTITDWYLIDRRSRKIVARASAPKT